jgi:hypothetical protein
VPFTTCQPQIYSVVGRYVFIISRPQEVQEFTMASPQSPRSDTLGNFRFEFDPVNRILMVRFEGRLSQGLVEQFYREGKECWMATDARAAILDGSSVTEVGLSSELIRQLARQDPVLELTGRPRVFVVPRTELFGLARMFQLSGESKQPHLYVVRTMDQAFALLGIQTATFEPIESRRAS